MANERARGLGYKFVTDDKYLVDPFSPTDGISYEGDGSPVSYANSGIMTQSPIIYPPIINQGGGGEGPPGPPGDDDDDENTTNAGITGKMDIAKNVLGFMMNPIAFGLTKAYQAYKNNQKQKADFAADQTYKAQQEKNFKEMEANLNNSTTGLPAKYNYAGRENNQGVHTSTKTKKEAATNQESYRGKDGGRVKYFFGGRVNYKAGGRIGFQGGGMSQGNEENQKQSAEMGNTTVSNNNNNNNDGGGNNTPTISKFVGSNVIESPFGELGGNTDTKIGYRGGVDLAKLGLTMGVDGTLTNRNFLTNDDIENKGTFYTGTDNDIFNTATNYDNSGIKDTFLNSNTPVGAFGVTLDNNGKVVQGTYGNNYKGVNVNATTNFDDLNNISLSKFSGDPTKNGFSYGIGANIDPLDLSNSNAYLQARYAYGQKKKNGGRIGFKNGGLAGLL